MKAFYTALKPVAWYSPLPEMTVLAAKSLLDTACQVVVLFFVFFCKAMLYNLSFTPLITLISLGEFN